MTNPTRARVLLFNPRSTSPGKQRLPLSLMAIGSVIEADYDIEFIDGNLIADPAPYIINRAHQSPEVKVLAVTVMPGPQLRQAVEVCKGVKRALPGLLIVWGGYFPTHHADVTVRSGFVDYCIEGQGEAPFRKLIDTIHHGGALADVPSLVYVDEHGEAKTNPRAPLVPLNNLPRYPYHRLDMERYAQRHYLGARTFSHHSSFGCPFACNFCAVVAFSHQRWLAESAARTASVIEHLHQTYRADAIEMFDMDFFVSEARTAEFSERITPLGINWWGLGRADTLLAYSDATFRKMKASGVKMIFMGAESGSDETLERMNKGGKSGIDTTVAIVERMKHYGIVPELSFVLGNPPDPRADIESTIEFIRKLKRINPAIELILYIYTPVPQEGTELYEAAKQLGFKFPETLEDWVNDDWITYALRRDPGTSWLHNYSRQRIRNFETVINAYYPTVTDTRLQQSWMKSLLRTISGWRYQLRLYSWPYELKALQRLVHYRRPETTGF